jgi:hypothetical protein
METPPGGSMRHLRLADVLTVTEEATGDNRGLESELMLH